MAARTFVSCSVFQDKVLDGVAPCETRVAQKKRRLRGDPLYTLKLAHFSSLFTKSYLLTGTVSDGGSALWLQTA